MRIYISYAIREIVFYSIIGAVKSACMMRSCSLGTPCLCYFSKKNLHVSWLSVIAGDSNSGARWQMNWCSFSDCFAGACHLWSVSCLHCHCLSAFRASSISPYSFDASAVIVNNCYLLAAFCSSLSSSSIICFLLAAVLSEMVIVESIGCYTPLEHCRSARRFSSPSPRSTRLLDSSYPFS